MINGDDASIDHGTINGSSTSIGNKVICEYYLRRRCIFGDQCTNLHQRPLKKDRFGICLGCATKYYLNDDGLCVSCRSTDDRCILCHLIPIDRYKQLRVCTNCREQCCTFCHSQGNNNLSIVSHVRRNVPGVIFVDHGDNTGRRDRTSVVNVTNTSVGNIIRTTVIATTVAQFVPIVELSINCRKEVGTISVVVPTSFQHPLKMIDDG